jgi:hypothetical protein
VSKRSFDNVAQRLHWPSFAGLPKLRFGTPENFCMQIKLYTDPGAFDDLAEEWHDLMSRTISAPLFMTVEYQKI